MVGETSTLKNEEGLEIDDGDIERNTTTNGEEEGEESSKDNDLNLLKTIPKEQLLKIWIETLGGTKKGRIYDLGLKNCLLEDSSNANCASSSASNPSNVPTQQIFKTSEFQQLLERVLDQRMTNMQEHMQAEVNIVVRAAVARILDFTPQPPLDGSGSPPNKS
ncbi:hypothetical protein K7X08_007118 [Anisodus acutangulus]|uniref:Uncharacterized protein n=1 Tax=Anisodus acutangulus TaxID=402998 RepID=A0A9Q1R199_9SOLA|nr:hypothetical protein K7X08_007118 [Anisodus acutangulus]